MLERSLGRIVSVVLLCIVLFVPSVALAQLEYFSKTDEEGTAPRWGMDDPVNVRQQVTQLYQQGLSLYLHGHFSEALPLAQRMLKIAEKGLSPDHPVVATALNDLGLVYVALGRYTEAEPLLKRSLAMREKAFGRDQPIVAYSLNYLAELYSIQGRHAEAEPLYKRSLLALEKAFGPDSLNVTAALSNLGILYQAQGRYADAEGLLKRSLAIRSKFLGPDNPDIEPVLNNLAVVYEAQGRYAEAEGMLKGALAIREKAFGPDHPSVAASLNTLAELYVYQGRYSDAEPLYKQSLAIREKALGPDHSVVAQSMNNLAQLYYYQGRYDDAEPLFKQSLAMREKALGPDHPDVAVSLNNLALVYQAQRRYAEAEQLYERSLLIAKKLIAAKAIGPDHPELATVLSNLAFVYQAEGRLTDAELLFKRSLTISEKALGPNHPNVAIALHNLALVYQAQGRYAEAEQLYERSLLIAKKLIAEKAISPDHPRIATLLKNLAVVYARQGRFSDAEPLIKRSLAIREKALGPDHPAVGESLNLLAALYRAQGRYADALPIVKRTISRNFANKSIAFAVLSDAESRKLIPPNEALDASYTVVQRSVSSAAGDAISKLAVRLAAGTNKLAQLVRKDQDLITEIGQLDKSIDDAVLTTPLERYPTMEDELRKRIDEKKEERAKLQEILNQQYPDYVALSKPQSLTIAQTQALLDDDEALVVIDLDQKSHVWLVTKDRTDWKELSVSAQDVSKEIATLRTGLDPNATKPFDRDLAYQLYRQLLQPIEGIIIQKKRLTFVFDGALTSLPPQVLITSDPVWGNKDLGSVDWLIRKYAVTVLPSVESLKVLRSQQPVIAAPKPMIGYGAPVFARTVQIPGCPNEVAAVNRSLPSFYHGAIVDMTALGKRLCPLPETANELHDVAKLLGAEPDDIKLGEDATVTDVKHERLSDYRVVYFATHALVAGQIEQFTREKAEPALVLSIPTKPSEEDNGLLTASEVATLKLNADFVVLSACNTADVGDKPGAEALSGLARAFFYAGARSLVVSYWEVDDEATVPLMDGLFTALRANPGLSHAEALRLSMLRIIDHPSEPVFSQPSFWAPFVIVGEPRK